MAEQDFQAILRKYSSLMGGPLAKSLQREEKEPDISSKSQQSEAEEPPTASFFQEEMEASLRGSAFTDRFIDSERFLRAPLKPSEQRIENSGERRAGTSQARSFEEKNSTENLLFHDLFSAVDTKDAFDSLVRENLEEAEDLFSFLEENLPKNLYAPRCDLREQYHPNLGLYPFQPLYIPPARKKR